MEYRVFTLKFIIPLGYTEKKFEIPMCGTRELRVANIQLIQTVFRGCKA